MTTETGPAHFGLYPVVDPDGRCFIQLRFSREFDGPDVFSVTLTLESTETLGEQLTAIVRDVEQAEMEGEN